MNDNLMDFLYDVSVMIMFVVALSLFLMIYPQSVAIVELLKDTATSEKAVYQGADIEDQMVSGAEIIGDIYTGQKMKVYAGGEFFDDDGTGETIEVYVDGDLIPPDAAISDTYYCSIDAYASYKVKKYYNSDGSIDAIEYLRS